MALTPDLSTSSGLLCAEDADDFASWTDGRSNAPSSATTSDHASDIWDLPFPDSNHLLSSLLASEPDLMPRSDYLSRLRDQSLDATSRQDAVNWILKVNELFRFRPVTAYLSVSYLDRFLSTHSLPYGATGGWPMQLLSVACVSVAAKVEETHVPLLVDLQSLSSGSRFLFEPRVVGRMELLLMSALEWRVQGITPFDFLPFFSTSANPFDLFPRASALIVGTQRVVDFLAYRPSEIAAAALLCAAAESAGAIADSLCTFEKFIDRDAVTGCRQLMEACVVATCPKVREVSLPPHSPIGVLDAAACGSCDSQRSSAPATPLVEPTGAEPPFKRRRVANCTEDDTTNTGGDLGLDLLCND